jgi:hypothetical protein
MPISPAKGFPSLAVAMPEKGTNAGMTVGAEAATGVDGTRCASPSERRNGRTTVKAIIELRDFIYLFLAQREHPTVIFIAGESIYSFSTLRYFKQI